MFSVVFPGSISQKPSIVLGTINYSLSGINSFNDSLCQGFRKHGFDCVVLSTAAKYETQAITLEHVKRESLNTARVPTWSGRWRRLRSFLKNKKPCIYIPNHDEAYSASSPTFPDGIFVVGVIHSDEDYHYRHFERLGSAWNACVCVSQSIQAEATRRYPDLAHKLVLIPNAVSVPSTFLSRESSSEIRLIYSGRLDQKQKRILDLVQIALGLRQLKVPFRLTIVGDGGTAQELRSLVESENLSQSISFLGVLPIQEVLNLYEKNDIVLLTSDFEGTPMAILEAMSRGCVPVCTVERSGLLDLIVDGTNGFTFEPGDISTATCAIRRLEEDKQLYRTMSYAAWRSMAYGPYNRDRQLQEYLNLFNKILNGHPNFTRVRGKPRPPHFVNASLRAELKSALLSLIKPWVFQ